MWKKWDDSVIRISHFDKDAKLFWCGRSASRFAIEIGNHNGMAHSASRLSFYLFLYSLSAQIIFIEKKIKTTCNLTTFAVVLLQFAFGYFTLRFKRHFWSFDSVLFAFFFIYLFQIHLVFFWFVTFCVPFCSVLFWYCVDWLAVTVVYGGSYLIDVSSVLLLRRIVPLRYGLCDGGTVVVLVVILVLLLLDSSSSSFSILFVFIIYLIVTSSWWQLMTAHNWSIFTSMLNDVPVWFSKQVGVEFLRSKEIENDLIYL